MLKKAVCLLAVPFLVSACSTAKRKTPELSDLVGKSVALVDIEGEPTERAVVEVALVNQLVKHGSFILINKRDVEAAKAAHDSDTTKWLEIAKKSGGEVALKAHVLEFEGDTQEGYSKEVINDSQLEAERGDGRDERVFKVKALRGKVRVELTFHRLDNGDERAGIAEATGEVIEESRVKAARLPPKMRFLEKLANQAFAEFFEKYQ
jgi:hypothetical protein